MARWQHAEGAWHAVDQRETPEPEVTFRAYCGAWVTPGIEDFAALGGTSPGAYCPGCLIILSAMRREARCR